MNDPPHETPAAPTCRRFTILDGMILTIAFALYLASMRVQGPLLLKMISYISWDGMLHKPDARAMCILILIWLAVPAVFALTPAYLLMRFRKPRPHLREIIREPGAFSTLIGFGIFGIRFLMPMRMGSSLYYGTTVAIVIFVTWLRIYVRNRVIHERGWIRLLGNGIALGWIVFGVCSTLLNPW